MGSAAPPPFIGREWALERVANWLAGEAQTLVITGDPGSGKSALTARIEAISSGTAPPPGGALGANAIAVLHACRALDAARIDPLRFVERVSAVIARLHPSYADALLALGDQRVEVHGTLTAGQVAAGADAAAVRIHNVNIGDMSAALAFERVIRAPLTEAPAPERPLVVVIDALDEALTLRADETLVDLLADVVVAGNLPRSLRLLMTSRPDRRVVDRLPAEPRFDLLDDAPVKPPTLSDVSSALDDVGRYAAERLTACEAPDPDRIAGDVAAAARGNFLYARYAIDDAIARDDFDIAAAGLPAGIDEWYVRYIDRELGRSRERWEERYRPLLGALAVARGEGLTRAQLEGIVQLPRSQVDDALVRLQQYVSGPDPDGPFRLYHQSFRDFLLANARYPIYAVEAHEAIARILLDAYGAHWLGCTDIYALDHAVAHLIEATRPPPDQRASRRLAGVVTDLTYLAARAHASRSTAAEADVAIAGALLRDTPELATLRRQLALIGPLVERSPTARDAASTLAARLAHVAGLEPFVGDLLARLDPPYLTARHPLPDLGHPSLVRTFDLPHPPHACAVTAEGTLVVAFSEELQIWDATTGTQTRRIPIEAPSGVALSADARHAACVSNDGWRVEIRSCLSGEHVLTLPDPDEPVVACALSVDGAIAATAHRDGEIELWDVDTGRRVDAVAGTSPIASCAVSADGDVLVWHVGTVSNLPGGDGAWHDEVFADGPLEIRFRGREGLLPGALAGRPVDGFALSADGRTLVVAARDEDDQTEGRVDARFWAVDLDIGAMRAIADRNAVMGGDCMVSADGAVAAVADPYDHLSIWSTDSGDVTVLEASHPTPVRLMALSTGGELAVSAINEHVSVWDARARTERARPEGQNVWATSPYADGTQLLCAVREEGVEIWDVELGGPTNALDGVEVPVEDCSASEDGRIAATLESSLAHWDDGEPGVKVWDLHTGDFRYGVPDAGEPMALSGDGRFLLVQRSRGPMAIWDVEAAAYLTDGLAGATVEISAAALSPDGTTAALGSASGTVEFWPDRAERIPCGDGHNERVLCVRFAPDGKTVVSSAADGTVKVWDEAGHARHTFSHGDGRWVRACALSPNGRHAASVDDEGCLKLWALDDERCLVTQYVHGVLFDCHWLDNRALVTAGTRGVYFFSAILND